jgi:tetratricopeptide (TPR) repeat protein
LLQIEPNNEFALRYRGETYHILGRYEESLEDINKLLEIRKDNTWALKAQEEVIRG